MAEVNLPKLDVSKDMSLEKCEERLSSYLLGAVTKKDDSALIANAILKGKVMSDKNNASLVTVSVDATGILDLLKDQLAATLQTYAHGTVNSCTIDNVKASWSHDNTRIVCRMHIEGNDQAEYSSYINRLKGVTTINLYRKFSQNANSGQLQQSVLNVAVRTSTSIQANFSDRTRGESKLSATIDKILTPDLYTDIQRFVRQLEQDGDPAADTVGTAKITYLRKLYGARSNSRLVDQIYRYVRFINQQKSTDQSIYQYVVELRGKLQFMARTTWTLNEILILMVYSTLLSTEEKTPNGIRIDHSKLIQDIRLSIEANSFMEPSELERRLYALRQETIGGDNLIHRALIMNSSNYSSGEKSFKRSKKTKKWKPPVITGVTWPKDAQLCFNCRRLDWKEKKPYKGWNSLKITGRKPHKVNTCKRTE